jgi:hypothetical protein
LFIISIKFSKFKTITSISLLAVTVAVLSSSFNNAISQKISPELNSAILFHLIEIETFHLFKIYHSQFDSSHSTIIISHDDIALISQLLIILSITSLSNHSKILSEYILSGIIKRV